MHTLLQLYSSCIEQYEFSTPTAVHSCGVQPALTLQKALDTPALLQECNTTSLAPAVHPHHTDEGVTLMLWSHEYT
jgi:hypothetical protein